MPQVVLLPTALSEIFCEASTTGTLSQADRYGLMAAVLDEKLATDDIATINRLLQAVKRGRIALAA